MIESDIVALLAADAAVSALVGQNVYAEPLPQGFDFAASQAISYRRVSGERDYTLSGPSGLARVRFQFDCWGKLFADALALGDAVIAALHTLPATDTRINGVVDAFDPGAELQRVIVDAEILYQT